LAADGFVLEIGVLEEEFLNEFGVEIFLLELSFGESSFDEMVAGWVFEVDEGHEFLVVFVHDSVFGEILECRVQMHTGVPSEIHDV
jgi:hypothetical protein